MAVRLGFLGSFLRHESANPVHCIDRHISRISQCRFAESYPNRADSYVNDYASILTAADRGKIRTQLMSVTQANVTVLTIGSIGDYTNDDIRFETFATQLFNHWGIGNAKRNDGVLLLVSKNDRKVRIELGKGFLSTYDNQAKRIIDDVIVPEFKQSRYSAGISNGVAAIAQMVEHPTESNSPNRGIPDLDSGWIRHSRHPVSLLSPEWPPALPELPKPNGPRRQFTTCRTPQRRAIGRTRAWFGPLYRLRMFAMPRSPD